MVDLHDLAARDQSLHLRERSRIVGMIGQPLLYLLIVGQGIASGLSLKGASGNVGYLLFMYPGILGMSVLFTSIFSGVSIIWDREFGFLKEVLVAPVPRWAVAVGKILGGATIAMAQSLILIVLAPFIGVGLCGVVVLELMLICFLISVAITGVGVFIAAGMRSMQGFQMLMNFLVMPLYFLSGAMFPVWSAPRWMKFLMTLDPLTYGVDALRNIVLTAAHPPQGSTTQSMIEAARDAGLVKWNLPIDAAIMASVGVVLAGLAAMRFNRASND